MAMHDRENRKVTRQDDVVHHIREATQPQLPNVIHGDRELFWATLERGECHTRCPQELVAQPRAPLLVPPERLSQVLSGPLPNKQARR
jgi:hypothetical protein